MEASNRITKEFIAEYFNISIEEASLVYEKLEKITYENNQAIITLGEEADALYFIEEGKALVYNAENEIVNEMEPGQYFGEYGILADEPRMTTVKAHGQVIAYKMPQEVFLDVVSKHPKVTGRLLKQVYSQITIKHTKLVSLRRRHRGLMFSKTNKDDSKLKNIFITYGITFILFLAVFLAAPHVNTTAVWWQLIPLVFLGVFTITTKRIIEGMLLTVILLAGMLYQGNFVFGFGHIMMEGIGNLDTAETILIMAMVEIMAALLSSAGVVSAFKKLAEQKVKSKPGSKFAMLLILIAICLDECLNVIAAGFCLNEISDKKKIPREERALLGSFSTGICAVIPFSLWGAYMCSWTAMYLDNGGNIFLKSIPMNLAGLLAVLFAILVCAGVFPKTKQLKEAYKRVENGGSLWPEGSESFFEEEEESDGVVGKPINLLLPMIVWPLSSILFGMIKNPGDFAMDAVSGLFVTLIFMFFFYIGQRLMNPREFFEVVAKGIENALVPILWLVLTERISECMIDLNLMSTIETLIPTLVGGGLFLIPMIMFLFCALISLGLGSSWGMYGLGIPICIFISTGLHLNIPLCLGATLAGGIVGELLCPYLDDTSEVVAYIGCAPAAYRKLRIQYWLPIGILCLVGYLILGILFI